jgi:glycosyltransferase involved in cell wall biosynthesis
LKTDTKSPSILFWAGGFAPVGGIESFLNDLILGLRGRGLESRLVCWGENSSRIRDLAAAGVPVRRLGWRWGCRWNWPDWALLASAGSLVESADVVVFGKLMPPRIHRRLTRAARPRFVFVTPYRPAEMWSLNPPPPADLNALDVIVVQARSFAADLRTLGYEGRIETLPYIPPECRPLAPFPPAPLRVGFLGRLAPQKNLPYLLRAMEILNRAREATLDLFGEGSERERLTALARDLGIERRVRFHGAIPPEAVPAAVDSCHVFAFSSLGEGQCLAALEILSRGRPVIATPVGAFPEMLADSRLGALSTLDAPAEFADRIRELGKRMLSAPDAAEQVQRAYLDAYDRESVLESYAWLFAGLAPTAFPAPTD